METSVYRGRRALPYLLMLPQLAVVAVFFYWPALDGALSSFYRTAAFGGSKTFAGWDNFARLFDPSSGYLQSVKVSVEFAAVVTIAGLAGSLLLAYCASNVKKGAGFYRVALIIPYAVAPAVVGMIFRFIFNPASGYLALFLGRFGIDWNPALNGAHAFVLVSACAVWANMSYNFVFFYAGLQAIPRSLIEASSIDGASRWTQFWRIVFPLLAPTTFFLLVMNLIYAFFETFPIIDVATQGGPGSATTTMVYGAYRAAFRSLDYGSAGAQSLILMGLIAVLTFFQFKYIDKKSRL